MTGTDVFTALAHGRKEMIEAIAKQQRVHCKTCVASSVQERKTLILTLASTTAEVERGADGKAMIRLMGNTTAVVSDITAKVCELIDNWRDEITRGDLSDRLQNRKPL